MIIFAHISSNPPFCINRFQISKHPFSHFPPNLQAPITTNPTFLHSSLFRPLIPSPRSHQHLTPYLIRPSAALASLDAVQPVLQACAVLAAIIIVHESGHFLAARLLGIHVTKFAVGFGPALTKFTAGAVEFSIRAFPLGGFVGFPDNDPDSDIPPDDPDLLKNRSLPDRALVISSGVIANVVFAYLIVLAQVVSIGLPIQESFPGVLVPDVRISSAAARGGLRAGDVILGVNGVEFPKSGPEIVSDVVDVIKKSPGKSVSLRVGRETDGILEINVVPELGPDRMGRIGVQLTPNLKITRARPKDLAEVINYTGREFWGLSYTVFDNLRQMFLNFSQSASKVSGPVAIIAVGAEVARSSSEQLYQFAAILNINLALINILPLPALDGGSLALVLIEAARGGKKIPQELEQRIMSSGITLVMLLGLFLIVRDTLNLDFIRELL